MPLPEKPTFGFEPDASYLAGLYPDKANGGAQLWYDPQNSPFKFTRYFPSILNFLPELSEKLLRRIVKKWARQYCEAPTLDPVRIPFHLLKYFYRKVENTDFVIFLILFNSISIEM